MLFSKHGTGDLFGVRSDLFQCKDSLLCSVHSDRNDSSLSFFIQLYQTTPSVREGNGGGGQKATDGHIIEGYCGVLR